MNITTDIINNSVSNLRATVDDSSLYGVLHHFQHSFSNILAARGPVHAFLVNGCLPNYAWPGDTIGSISD